MTADHPTVDDYHENVQVTPVTGPATTKLLDENEEYQSFLHQHEQQLLQSTDVSQLPDDRLLEASKKFNSLERFVIRAAERHKKLAFTPAIESDSQENQQQVQQQNNHNNTIMMLFSCQEQIVKDYRRIVELYSSGSSSDTNINNANSSSIASGANSGEDDVVDIHLHAASHIAHQFLLLADVLKDATKLWEEQQQVENNDKSTTTNLKTNSNHSINYKNSNKSKSPIRVVFSEIEKYILVQFAILMYDMSSITAMQASRMICWYDNFVQNIQHVYDTTSGTSVSTTKATSLRISSAWDSDVCRLLDRYLDHGVRNEMNQFMKWAEKEYLDITDEELTISEIVAEDGARTSGGVITTFPEELIYLFDVQLQRATENLPGKYVTNVVDKFLDVTREILDYKLQQIDNDWFQIRSIVFCAIINNIYRLKKLLQNRMEYFIDSSTNENDNGSTHTQQQQVSSDPPGTATFEVRQPTSSTTPNINSTNSSISVSLEQLRRKESAVQQQLTELKRKASESLSRKLQECQLLQQSPIVDRVTNNDSTSALSTNNASSTRSSVLERVGKLSWEKDSTGAGVTQIVVTVLEHFSDLEQWLVPCDDNLEIIPQALLKSLHFIVQTYIQSFYHNTMRNGVNDPHAVSKNLRLDYATFQEFLNSHLVTKHLPPRSGGNDDSKKGTNDNNNVARNISSNGSKSWNFTNTSDDITNQQHQHQKLFALLRSMSRLVDPIRSPLDLLSDIRIVMELITTVPLIAPVLHLAGLRGQLNKAQSSEWVHAIAITEAAIVDTKRFNNDNNNNIIANHSTISCTINLPDITNSPFIYRVRVVQEDIDLMFPKSDTRMLFYAQATKDTLEAGFQKLVASYMERKLELETSIGRERRRSFFFG